MAVTPGSIAVELELEPGDVLLTIDGEELEDIFDYDYMTDAESFVLSLIHIYGRGDISRHIDPVSKKLRCRPDRNGSSF